MAEASWAQAGVRTAVFVMVLGVIAALPLLVLTVPLPLGPVVPSVLFIVPQQVVPWNTFTGHGQRAWPGLWVLMWAALAIGFGWLARRRSLGSAVGASLLLIVIGTIALRVGMAVLGWTFEFDGP